MAAKNRGFTIIELMIVITIIAIIATIAIPSLLRARMAANEVAAIGTLKTIATGQVSFRRQDYAFTGGTMGAFEYAKPFTYLHLLDDGTKLDFVDVSVNNAHFTNGNDTPKTGYYYYDLLNYYPAGSATAVAMDFKLRYGITAAPAEYNLTGLNSFYRDDKGLCWQADTGLGTDATTYHTMHEMPGLDGFIANE